eukprot:6473598-Amphidinium_carterae.1
MKRRCRMRYAHGRLRSGLAVGAWLAGMRRARAKIRRPMRAAALAKGRSMAVGCSAVFVPGWHGSYGRCRGIHVHLYYMCGRDDGLADPAKVHVGNMLCNVARLVRSGMVPDTVLWAAL